VVRTFQAFYGAMSATLKKLIFFFRLLGSLLVVRLALLDFLHRLVHELNGFLAMSPLVWGGFVQLCSGLLQVAIGCAHMRLATRHLCTLGMTSQRMQAQSD